MTALRLAHSEERRLLRPWSLSSELAWQFLPRMIIAIMAGLFIGSLIDLAEFSELGYLNTVVASSFWAAAFMMGTFRGHAGRMLFWLLLLDSGLLLYQVSIYAAVKEGYVFLRLGPAILAGILFVTFSGGRAQQRPFLYFLWIACNLPSFVSGSLQGYLSFTDASLFFAVNVFYPLVFYYAIGCMVRTAMPLQVIWDSIAVSVLVLSCIPLLLIPVELSLRESESFASLQFGGRAYSVIGGILLMWPIVMANVIGWRPSQRLIAFGLIILVFATSFSRGAIAMLLLLLVGNLFLARRQRGRLFLTLGIISCILVAGAVLALPQWTRGAGWFWLARMNVGSELATGVFVDTGEFFEAGRGKIWQMAVALFKESPLWGYGIGSTPSLISNITFNEASYSGMHSLALTVLVERGLIGLCGVLVLIGRVGYLVLYSKTVPVSRGFMAYSFIIFLLFANSTGVELFLNSTRSMNVTVTVYLFLLIGFLEYGIGTSRPSIRKTNVPTRPDSSGTS